MKRHNFIMPKKFVKRCKTKQEDEEESYMDNVIRNSQVERPSFLRNCGDIIWFKFMKIGVPFLILSLCFIFAAVYNLRSEIGYIRKDYVYLKGEVEMIKNVQFMIEAKMERIWDELKKSSKIEPNRPILKIDDTSVQEKIDKYPDYALESRGASIVTTRDTQNFPKGGTLSLFGVILCSSDKGAKAILQPNISPGECWAFKGSSGAVVIELFEEIFLTGISVEHISKHVSPSNDVSSAPKEFSVSGLKKVKDPNPYLLGKFVYKVDNHPLQYFEIKNINEAFKYVEINFLTNNGHPDFTCVYRIRIHGILCKGK